MANDQQGMDGRVIVEVSADTSRFATRIRAAKAQAVEFERAAQGIGKNLGTEKAAQSFNKLSASSRKYRNSLESAAQSSRQINRSTETLANSSRKVNVVMGQYNRKVMEAKASAMGLARVSQQSNTALKETASHAGKSARSLADISTASQKNNTQLSKTKALSGAAAQSLNKMAKEAQSAGAPLKGNIEAVEQSLNSFSAKTAKAGSNSKALSKDLEKGKASMDKLKSSSEGAEEAAKAVGKVAKQAKNSAKALQETAKGADAASSASKKVGESFKSAATDAKRLNKVTKAVKEEFKDIAGFTIKANTTNAQRSLTAYTTKVIKAKTSTDKLTESVKKNKESFDDLGKSVDKVKTAGMEIGGLTSKAARSEAALRNTAKAADSTANSVKKVGGQAKEASTNAEILAKKLQGADDKWKVLTKRDLKANSKEAEKSLDGFTAKATAAKKASDNLTTSANKNSGAIDKSTQKTKQASSAVDALANSSRNRRQGLQATSQLTEKSAKSISMMGKEARGGNAALGQFANKVRAAQNATGKLTAASRGNQKTLGLFTKNVDGSETAAKRLSDSVNKTNKVLTEAGPAAKTASDGLATYASTGEGTKRVLAGFRSEVLKLQTATDASSSRVIQTFASEVDKIKDATVRLQPPVKSIQAAMDAFGISTGKAVAAGDRQISSLNRQSVAARNAALNVTKARTAAEQASSATLRSSNSFGKFADRVSMAKQQADGLTASARGNNRVMGKFASNLTESSRAADKLSSSSRKFARSMANTANQSSKATKSTDEMVKVSKRADTGLGKYARTVRTAEARAGKFVATTDKGIKTLGNFAKKVEQTKSASERIAEFTSRNAIELNRLAGASNNAASATERLTKAKRASSSASAKTIDPALIEQLEQFTKAIGRATAAANRFQTSMNKARSSGGFARSTRAATNAAKKLKKEASEGEKRLAQYRETLAQLGDAAGLVTGPLGGIASRIAILSRITSTGALAVVGLATAFTGLAFFIAAAVREATLFETSFLRLEGVIKATGNSAGFTAQEIRELASDIARNTLASVDGIEAAAAKLLTFRSVQEETFENALRVSQDLAALGFTSVSGAATMLGKALEDPVAGMSSLKEAGVQLTIAQKDTIKGMMDQGKLFEAQVFLLKAVEDQVKGTAEAMATGLAGAYDTLGQNVSEFLQGFAEVSKTKDVWEGFVNFLVVASKNARDLVFDEPLKDLLKAREELAKLESKPESEMNLTEVIVTRQKVAALREEIAALEDKTKVERDARKAADESAAAARKQFEEEARNRKAREEAAKALKRLVEMRKEARRTLTSEVGDLQYAVNLYQDTAMSINQVANAREKELMRSNLQLDANSKEWQSLSELIDQRQKLSQAFEMATVSREQERAFSQSMEKMSMAFANVQQQIDNLDSGSFNTTEDAIAAAKRELERFNFVQTKTNEIMTRTGQTSLTADQSGQINEMADRYIAMLDRLKAAEKQRDIKIFDQDQIADFRATKEELLQEIAEIETQTEVLGQTTGIKNMDAALAEAARAAQVFRFQQDLLNETLQETGDITEEQRNRIKGMSEEYGGLLNKLAQVSETQEKAAEAVRKQQESMEKFQTSLAEGLTEMVTSGKTMEDVLKNLIVQMGMAIIKAQMLKAVQAATNAMMGSDAGSLLGTAASVVSGGEVNIATPQMETPVMHTGGMVGGGGGITRSVPVSNFINAPRFHDGLKPDEFPAILQEGEEVVPKNKVGRNGPDTQVTNRNIIMNIQTPDADSFRKSQRQINRQTRSRMGTV